MIDLQLEGQVAIVTGASRGLGQAAALALVEQGVRVLAAARSLDELKAMEKSAPGKIAAAHCDMKDADTVAQLPGQAIDAFGRLDIVINNAGIAPAGFFLEQSEEVWDDVMAVNVKAPATLARAAGQHMIAQGSGKIINIASTSGILGKVQVNAIAPGAFETDAQRFVLESPDILKRRLGKIPVRRMGQTDEIGPLICYLASPASNFVTGSVFVIDGGESCKL